MIASPGFILLCITISFVNNTWGNFLKLLSVVESAKKFIPLSNIGKIRHHKSEYYLRRHEEMMKIFDQYIFDAENGYMSFKDFESKRLALLDEYTKLYTESLAYEKEYKKAKRDFWASEPAMMDELTLEFQLKTLRKSLTIYQNPSLTVQDAHFGDNSLTGYLVWVSGATLANYLEQSCLGNCWIRGKKILDISSGTGFVGMTAACLGGDVTATDLPEMMGFLQKNIEENSEQLEGTGGKIRTQILRWGDAEGVKSIPKADVILMSGLVYHSESVEPLVSTLVALSDENTQLIIANEDWSDHREILYTWNDFYDCIRKYFELAPISTENLEAPIEALGSARGVLLFQAKKLKQIL